LFEASHYRFYADGQAQDLLKANLCPYQIDTSEACGCVYWVWEDETMSLAAEEIQEAYREYVARLIVT
jgi:hypothetical protein